MDLDGGAIWAGNLWIWIWMDLDGFEVIWYVQYVRVYWIDRK